MCFVFTCGEHTFRKEVQGYEGQICKCHNCGNFSARVIKSHPWFTFCFVPVIPLSMKGYEELSCHVCRFNQPLAHRPDVQPGGGPGGGIPGGGGGQNMPMYPPGRPPHGPPGGGWQGGPPPGAQQQQQPGAQQPMRYG